MANVSPKTRYQGYFETSTTPTTTVLKPIAVKAYQRQPVGGYFPKFEGNNSSSNTTLSSPPTTPQIPQVLAPSLKRNDGGYDSDSSEEGRKPSPPQTLGLRVFNPDDNESVVGTVIPIEDKKRETEVAAKPVTISPLTTAMTVDHSPVPSETEWKVFKQPNQNQIQKPDLPPHDLPINGILSRRVSKTLDDTYADTTTNQTKECSTPNESSGSTHTTPPITLPLSPVPSSNDGCSEFASPTSPNYSGNKPSTSFANPVTSKYAKVSYHLTNDPTAIKKYREMAEKTNDPTTQLMFAKYLLETANAFDPLSKNKVIGSMWGSSSTTNKSQRPEPYLVVPPPDHDSVSTGSKKTKSMEIQSIATGSSLNYQQPASLMNVTLKQQIALNNQRKSAAETATTTTNETNDQKRKLLEQEGIKWIVRLAKQNVPEACYMQASWMEKQQYGFKPNKSKSFALHQVAAKSNIPESVFAVAKHYEEENSLEAAKIVRFYQSAANAGYVNAIYKLAFLTIYGKLGLRQSMTEGLSLMYKACTLASEEFNIPPYTFSLILTNEYEEVDFPEAILEPYGGKEAAILYCERAARLNNHHAQAKLGSIYEHGLYGESMNFARAFDYYEQAAINGNDKAMLGLCRLNNRGSHGPGDKNESVRLENDVSGWLAATPVNEDLAFSWCEKAAKAGNVDALSLLGWFYESGFGVPRDFGAAQKYYELAVEKGDRGAKTRLMNTNTSITKKQHESIPVIDRKVERKNSKRKSRNISTHEKKQSSCRCM